MAFLPDGFQTFIIFALLPGVLFKEKEVKPPAMQAGGAIDVTTMRNNTVRTRWHKSLTTLSEMNVVVSYDTSVYTQIYASLLQRNGLISVNFPDNSLLTFQGWLDEFTPNQLKEGDFPLADAKIIPSLLTAGVETAWTFTPATRNPYTQ